METITSKKPHAIVLTSPGMGHLTPFVELVNNLVSNNGFEVTFFVVISETSKLQSQTLSATSNNKFLHVHVLQPDVSPQLELYERLFATMRIAISDVRSVICNMKVTPDLLIADLFGLGCWDLADEFGMSKYVFMTASASFLALSVYIPFYDEYVVGNEEDRGSEYISIPGCEPVTKNDKLLPLIKYNPLYSMLVDISIRISMSDAIIVNSWPDLEPKTIKSLNDPNLLGRYQNGKVYAVGPLVKQVAPSENETLKWMDKQPDESVIYVSFGSGGSLTYDQTQEIAWGLELSKQRFIWVLRPPSDKDASNFFFSIDIGDGATALDYLPHGFLSRTKDVGFVVPMWASQSEILGHKAIGGFITHCGWNSVIESIINGVPMVAWPLYAEQGFNARMLTEELKIAVKVEASLVREDDLIDKEEIEKAIRKIMTDKGCHEIRERVMKLKNGAVEARVAGKGSSYKSFWEFSMLCTMKMK